jgi:enoyl-CoA hydratase
MTTNVDLLVQEDVARMILSPVEPGKPPALDHSVLDVLDQQIALVERRVENLRALVVQSAVPRYFCVGANVHALRDLNPQTISAWVEHGHAVFNRLSALPMPVIARVEGFAMGGGLELALACDLIAAAETARLSQPEAGLGFVTGWGASFRLPRRVGVGRAALLLYTGRVLTALEAYEIGLVDQVAAPEDLDGAIEKLLEGIRRGSPLAMAEQKRLLAHSALLDLTADCAEEAAASIRCLESPETQQRVTRFLERKMR